MKKGILVTVMSFSLLLLTFMTSQVYATGHEVKSSQVAPQDESIYEWMPNLNTQKKVLTALIEKGLLPEGSKVTDITKELLANDGIGLLYGIDDIYTPNMFKGLEYLNGNVTLTYVNTGGDNDYMYQLTDNIDFTPLKKANEKFGTGAGVVWFELSDYNHLPTTKFFNNLRDANAFQIMADYSNGAGSISFSDFVPKISNYIDIETTQYKSFYVGVGSFWSDFDSTLTAFPLIGCDGTIINKQTGEKYKSHTGTIDELGNSHLTYIGTDELISEIQKNPDNYYLELFNSYTEFKNSVRHVSSEIYYGFK